MSIFAMILTASSIFTAAQAAERLPITSSACYKAQYIAEWRYEKSPNVYNGRREHAAYLMVQFSQGRDSQGRGKIEVDHIPASGLVWDVNFKNVIYNNGGTNPVICARESFFGQHKLIKNCSLEGKLIDLPDPTLKECGGEPGVEFDGAIVIKN